jgi:hypothetical protein
VNKRCRSAFHVQQTHLPPSVLLRRPGNLRRTPSRGRPSSWLSHWYKKIVRGIILCFRLSFHRTHLREQHLLPLSSYHVDISLVNRPHTRCYLMLSSEMPLNKPLREHFLELDISYTWSLCGGGGGISGFGTLR